MRGKRRNSRETKRKIMEAATTMFAASGYEATSLRQIAGSAGIDLATLKYHYGDKPTLFAECYRRGHMAFLEWVTPIFAKMDRLNEREELVGLIQEMANSAYDYVYREEHFVRLLLYRIMEDSADNIGLEEELQGIAVTMLEGPLNRLVERGAMRPIDTRALITFIVSSIPMWFVTAKTKPKWIGDPLLDEPEGGRERAIGFLTSLLEHALLFPEEQA